MAFTMIALLETIVGLWILARSPNQEISASPSLESVGCGDTDPSSQLNKLKHSKFRLIRQYWQRLKCKKTKSPSDVKEKLQMLDDLFLITVPTAYIIFVSVMFASNPSWEDPKVPGEPDKFAAWLY